MIGKAGGLISLPHARIHSPNSDPFVRAAGASSAPSPTYLQRYSRNAFRIGADMEATLSRKALQAEHSPSARTLHPPSQRQATRFTRVPIGGIVIRTSSPL
jgi:hypothetical protein